MSIDKTVFVVRVKDRILGVFYTFEDASSARAGLIINDMEQEQNILLEEIEENVERPWIRLRLP